MLDLPRGTVTFLFTDIEGSTRLWQQSPAEMGAALARHDALLREVIEQNDGTVFKTVGDAFCAAFPTAAAALAAARAAQLALAQQPWPEPVRIDVRMALHTGTAEVRDNDYFGQPLNRVGRLLAVGHGGQVLLSVATQELLRDSLPASISLRDMGDRRLKDLIRPERVYQMVALDLPADFPPLRTLDARAHNLPIQLTSFVGREREMQELKGLLKSSRLVTLTGSGGAGKTRLALQVGADCIDDFADGVWFVELAPLTDARLVPQAVTTVLGIKEQPGVSLTDTLLRETRDKELLLVLDNCEHLVEASALLCQALLSACAKVRILVTSREALRLPGEATYRVPSLATPDPKALTRIAALTQYAAVQLFIDRALAVQSAFRVDNQNAPAVASICHHLDGIPLAIELAAARVRSLSVEEVNERLDQRFHLLTGGSRTALPRQQTLRSAIDWSYDLLRETEQALLCRLSAFAGGWTLNAGEQVCSGEGVDNAEVLDLLTSLADKSLVVAEERNGATRYRLLETVRQYAQDRIRESGEETQWRKRHLAHFLALAEDAEPHLRGADQQAWFDRLETEHDNLRSALAWSSAPGSDTASGLRLAGSLWRFWYAHGYLGEGRNWLTGLLAAARLGDAAPARAKALQGAGAMAVQQGDYPAARGLFEEGLRLRRELGDQRGIAGLLGNLGVVASDQGDYPGAQALQEECLAIFRELGDWQGVANSLHNLGNVANHTRDYPAARELYEESLAIQRELGDQRSIAMMLGNLGLVAYHCDDYPAARTLYAESLAIFRALGERQCIAVGLTNLASVTSDQHDYRSARPMLDEALAIFRELGDRRGIAETLGELAHVAFALAGPGRAARIWGRVEWLREEIGLPLPPSERPRYDRQVATARATLGDDAAFDVAWQEGRAMTLEQAIGYALEKQNA